MKTDLKSMIEAMSEQVSSYDMMAGEQLAKISAVIAKNRIDRGMTQKEFADFLGVSQGMVSKWESEDYNFSIAGLAKICDKLNLELEINIKDTEKTFDKRNVNRVAAKN